MKIKLMLGDCLERMKEIPDGSIDMILADPPYGTTACRWDTIIPLEPMWEQLKRIAKKNAAIVLFGMEPFSSRMRLSNWENFKYDWIWCKTKSLGFTNAKNKPLNKHETVSVFSEGTTANRSNRRMPYYPQDLVPLNKIVNGIKTCKADNAVGGHKFARPSHKIERLQEFTNYPNSLLYFSSEGKTVHPTQKPVALMEYLIKTYTHEGETVLDFTMGSGTTGVACVSTGRNFIGIEQDQKYYKIAIDRIKAARNTP
jgi:site-specific DNA-methyltransferase (adenine-specific)